MKIYYFSVLFMSLLSWQQVFAVEKNFTLEDVQLHNSVNDCWIVVNNKVYDITQFIEDHETKCKKMNLIDFCGKDVSEQWIEKEKSEDRHKHRSILIFESSQNGFLAN